MNIPEDINKVVKNHGLSLTSTTNPISRFYGIGDILFLIILKREGMIDDINFNLAYFNKRLCNYFDNPINALIFRIEMLEDLNVDVNYLYVNNISANQSEINYMIKKIKNFKISIENIPTILIKEPYIIFHSKIKLCNDTYKSRFQTVKNNARDIFSTFRSKYTIVIMGEREFITNFPGVGSRNETIYDELMLLKDNNEILDLTEKTIYDNLDYSNFKEKLSIIERAECNFTFSWGGPFCMSLIFGKKCITYIDQIRYKTLLDVDNLALNNTYIYEKIEDFKDALRAYSINT